MVVKLCSWKRDRFDFYLLTNSFCHSRLILWCFALMMTEIILHWFYATQFCCAILAGG